jgi:hypothetical protein
MGNSRFLIKFGDGFAIFPSNIVIKIGYAKSRGMGFANAERCQRC